MGTVNFARPGTRRRGPSKTEVAAEMGPTSAGFGRRPPASPPSLRPWELDGVERPAGEELWALGAALADRLAGPGASTPAEALQRFLGTDEGAVHTVTVTPGSRVQATCSARRLRELVREAVWTHGAKTTVPPEWTTVTLPDGAEQIPAYLVAAMPAGTLAPAPMVVRFAERGWNEPPLITTWSRTPDADHANAWTSSLISRSMRESNPYRQRRVQADWNAGRLTVAGLELPTDQRDDLVLDTHIWRNVRDEILHLIDRAPLLDELGLGARRGILLVGPRGVGKTKLVRTIAAEVLGRMTVLVATPDAARYGIQDVYEAASDLAPSVVVLDDLDLVVGERGGGPGSRDGIHQLLAALDGAATSHAGVVTLATTNDAAGLDRAVTRPSRFDRVIEIGLPKPGQRGEMMCRFLGRLTDHVDTRAVAEATDGMTGAELRELARLAVLRHGEDVTTERLLAGMRDLADSTRLRTGQYL